MALGWYMEMDEHLDSSYGVWSKIEGERSKLSPNKLAILKSWDSSRDGEEIMSVLNSIVKEFLSLNQTLSLKVSIDPKDEMIEKSIRLIL